MPEVAPATQSVDAGSPSRDQEKPTRFRESIESLLVTVILAIFGTSFVVQAFKIPSQSMEPTLLVGDHLLVNKFIFGGRGAWYERVLPYRKIRRGDIIVFKFPYDDHSHYVKRVIGLPGDRIRIVDERVYVNDQLLHEPQVVHDPAAYDPYGASFPPSANVFLQSAVRPEWAAQISQYIRDDELVVPADHYFVMGDNRDHSWDSRYWGFVDQNAIMGRPVVIYWSIKSVATADTSDRGLIARVISMADTILHLPLDTRWRRMFHEVH